MKESSATIKLLKSEIDWVIIALAWASKGALHHELPNHAQAYDKLKRDFKTIKEQIIQGEKELEINGK